MRFLVLTDDGKSAVVERFLSAAAERGHQAATMPYLKCIMNMTAHRPHVLVDAAPLKDVDAVVPLVDHQTAFYGAAVVRQFDMMGVWCLNSAVAISRAMDKLYGLQLLASKGVDLPATGFAHSSKQAAEVIQLVGGTPVVIKLPHHSHGGATVLAETETVATSVIEAFRGLDVYLFAQEFIAEAKCTDLRTLVLGDKVVAAVQRTATDGEFLPNARKIEVKPAKLRPAERKLAVQAAKAMRLRCAGVDILRADRGPVVMDVHAAPDLLALEAATHVDVALKLVTYMEKQVAKT